MQWEARATVQRPEGAATMVLGASDHGKDIMEVLQSRLPPGEWDVRAWPVREDRAPEAPHGSG